MKLRISPSKLEVFRKWIDGELNGWFTEEKVIESIKGEKKWTPQANFGVAFHAILEFGPERFYDEKQDIYVVRVDDMPESVTLLPEEITEAITFRAKHPVLIHEIKTKWETTIKTGKAVYPVVMYMRIDGIEGVEVHEHKTTKRPAKPEDYERSVQWKAYLLASQAQAAHYNIFAYKEPKKGPRWVDPMFFTLYPYQKMEKEVISLLNHFVRFCENKDLLEYVRSKF